MTRRDPRPPDRPGLAASFGPERLAAILSVVVIAVVGIVAIGGASGGTSPSPSSSLASAGPTTAGTSSAPSSAPATPVATPATWASGAATLIEIEEQIVVARDALAEALADDATPTSLIARDLRAMNTAMTTALRAIDALRARGAPSDLVADLASEHQAALDAGVQTLQASLQNAPAYRAGGADVVAALAGIEDLAARLRTEAGLP